MKTKKSILCTILFTLFIFSCKGQTIIPTEKHINYINNHIKITPDSYIKDVNGVLNKFIGLWKGTYNNQNFLFDIRKTTDEFLKIKNDILTIRYRITDSAGKEIINTLALPDSSLYVIGGLYLAGNGGYRLFYQGYESECGQKGEVIIHVREINNQEQMSLYLEPMRDLIDPADCPNETTQLLPTEEAVILTKQ